MIVWEWCSPVRPSKSLAKWTCSWIPKLNQASLLQTAQDYSLIRAPVRLRRLISRTCSATDPQPQQVETEAASGTGSTKWAKLNLPIQEGLPLSRNFPLALLPPMFQSLPRLSWRSPNGRKETRGLLDWIQRNPYPLARTASPTLLQPATLPVFQSTPLAADYPAPANHMEASTELSRTNLWRPNTSAGKGGF